MLDILLTIVNVIIMITDSTIVQLDCVGLYCPQPLIQTRIAINRMSVGDILEIIADDPAAEEDLKRFCKRTGHELVDVQKFDDGSVQLHIRKSK